MWIGVLPCRFGSAKLTRPSPPYVVPSRENSAWFWLIGISWPLHSAHPFGAKPKLMMRISDRNGSAIGQPPAVVDRVVSKGRPRDGARAGAERPAAGDRSGAGRAERPVGAAGVLARVAHVGLHLGIVGGARRQAVDQERADPTAR